MGLCLPISRRATRAANRPRIWPSASIKNHCFPSIEEEGKYVVIPLLAFTKSVQTVDSIAKMGFSSNTCAILRKGRDTPEALQTILQRFTRRILMKARGLLGIGGRKGQKNFLEITRSGRQEPCRIIRPCGSYRCDDARTAASALALFCEKLGV